MSKDDSEVLGYRSPDTTPPPRFENMGWVALLVSLTAPLAVALFAIYFSVAAEPPPGWVKLPAVMCLFGGPIIAFGLAVGSLLLKQPRPWMPITAIFISMGTLLMYGVMLFSIQM